LLLLSAADLDPRNDGRRLEAAADYATMLINVDSASWQRPIAEAMYLLSQELGGHEEELANAEAAKQEAQQTAAALRRKVNLPSSTRESWPARLQKVQADKDALSKKVDQLQAALKAKDKDLTDAKAELDRIKKTLKIK
jgi:chromosome segregation ATPase